SRSASEPGRSASEPGDPSGPGHTLPDVSEAALVAIAEAPARAPVSEPAPPLAKRLEIPPYDLQAALKLERELGISHALAQVLARRGLADPELAGAYLEPRESHPPTAF